MRNRNRMIAAAAAVAAVLAAGSGAAVASTSGGKPGAPAQTVSVSKTPTAPAGNGTQKPPGPSDNGGQAALVAAVAAELHLSTAQVSAALQPLFAGGSENTSSFIPAAARSLGVSTQQLANALVQAKQSLGPGS